MTDVTKDESQQILTTAGWKKAAFHTPLLPSGARVKIRIPDLPRLIETGKIPNHLLDAALGVAASGEDAAPTKELIAQQREFTDTLVMITVAEPKLTEADMEDVPYEDKEMIVAFATRQRDLDAEGEHLAGLTKSDKFRKFRLLGEFDPSLEGA
jgi:hypothetical protein